MICGVSRASRRRAVLCSLGLICILLAGCSQTFRQIAIPLPTTVGDPAPLNRALFAATDGAGNPGSVTYVDVPGDTNVGVAPVGNNPIHIGLTFGGGRAVTSNTGDNTASSFQTSVTFPPITTTSLPASANPVFSHSRQVSKFYIAFSGLDKLGVVDGTLSLVKQVDLTPEACSSPVAISQVPNGGIVYVACKGSGNVVSVTSSDNALIAHSGGIGITVGSSPVWIDTSSDGKYTFVANQGSSTVSVICTTSDITVCPGDTVIATIGVGGAPSFLKYDVHSQRVYVAGAGFVSIIDASGTTPTFAVLVPPAPLSFSGNTWVTALQDGTRFYVSASGSHDVTVYSASSMTKIKSIDLTIPDAATVPIMIDSDKNSTKVYTANTGSNDFTIIRTSDDTEVLPGSSTSGRLVAPPVANTSCTPVGSAACRQTPTYVQVLQ